MLGVQSKPTAQMNPLHHIAPLLVVASFLAAQPHALAVAETEKGGEAWSRIIRHYDGTRTHSEKQGNKDEIVEETFDEAGVLIAKRVFKVDSKGRLRHGYIYDGRGQPLGTTMYGYTYDRISEQRVFDAKGRLVSRLFPPGALPLDKFPANQRHSVRFNYNPTDPKAAPKIESTNDKILTPVDKPMDNFVPGMPIGGNVIPAKEQKAGDKAQESGEKKTSERLSFFQQRNKKR